MTTDLPLIYSPTPRHSNSFLTNLYHNNERLGEMVLSPESQDDYWSHVDELRVTSFSTPSERCPPILVLHTMDAGVAFKLAPSDDHTAADLSALQALHASCLRENKTAVAPIGGGHEVHLVPMLLSQKQVLEGMSEACFWGFVVVDGMYESCLAMLNLRCLAMVLDLDETLIVANTSKTFDDRIEALNRRLMNREDPAMAATLKRFQADKSILEQYIKTDQVFHDGKLHKAQSEVVPPVAEGAIPLIRPIVRLPGDVILTRINPAVRDTSVLVRLRPNWDDLKTYMLANNRKRFEPFICTMSERDYALEMWRLLDPNALLINPRELNERVTCVKSDAKKALKDCFPRFCFHPKMAMVIDDRLPVWEKSDQPRVHEVQPFMPYTDPKSESNKELPPLFIARNIACNVRGYFFRELDEVLTAQFSTEVKFDTEVHTLPKAPDVSSYIIPEVVQEEVGPNFAANGVSNFHDGMANAEVSMSLKPQGVNGLAHSRSFSMESDDLRSALKQPLQQQQQLPPPPQLQPPLQVSDPRSHPQYVGEVSNVDPSMYIPGDGVTYPTGTENMHYPPRRHISVVPVSTRLPEGNIQSSPGREEGEVPETDIDPDTRRRLLILQHGMDASKPPAPAAPPLQVQIPPVVAPGGGWLGIEEEMSPRRPSRRSPELVLEPESPSFDRSAPPGFENPFSREQQLIREAARRQRNDDEYVFAEGRPQVEASSFSDEESATFVRGGSREPINASRTNLNAISALHEVGQRVKRTVQYRTDLRSSTHIGFTVEVMFGGEKIGEGIGRTRKDAKYNAAESALLYLANKASALQSAAATPAPPPPPPVVVPEPVREVVRPSRGPRDPRLSAGLAPLPRERDRDDDVSPIASTSGHVPMGAYHSSEEPVSYNHVEALKELCTREAINIQFKALPTSGAGQHRQAFRCQVEVGGRTLGRGSGPTWNEAKQEAAKEAYVEVEMNLRPHKRGNGPPRSPGNSKRMRTIDSFKDRGVPSSLSPVRGRSRLSPRRQARNLSPIP